MTMICADEFSELSRESWEYLKNREYPEYIRNLKKMAAVLKSEGKLLDEIKVLMLAFFLDINVQKTDKARLDVQTATEIREAMDAVWMNWYEMRQLFIDTVRDDTSPTGRVSASDSLYLLELCLNDRQDEADKILTRIVKQETDCGKLVNCDEKL